MDEQQPSLVTTEHCSNSCCYNLMTQLFHRALSNTQPRTGPLGIGNTHVMQRWTAVNILRICREKEHPVRRAWTKPTPSHRGWEPLDLGCIFGYPLPQQKKQRTSLIFPRKRGSEE